MLRPTFKALNPLCHFVTCPPQGGRLLLPALFTASHAALIEDEILPFEHMGSDARSVRPISPLEGEMPGRAEGGVAATTREVAEARHELG